MGAFTPLLETFMRNRSLILAAVLGGLAAAAQAQSSSSLTIYGRIDMTVGKRLGTDNKALEPGTGNRLGVIGTEDLGGGLRAFFNMEHGFEGQDGSQTDAARFWNRRSFVGIEGNFGRVFLGRDYTPAYLYAQLQGDPFGHTQAPAQLSIDTGGIAKVRVDNTVNYAIKLGAFGLAAQVGESNGALVKSPDRPMALGLNYKSGPLYVGYGYDNPGGENDVWHFATANYKFGDLRVLGSFGTGKTDADAKRRSYQLGAEYQIGGGEIRFVHGILKDKTADRTLMQRTGLGYHYSLSKRTTVYVNLAHDSKLANEKSAYDLGLYHAF